MTNPTINECVIVGYINNQFRLRQKKNGAMVTNLWLETVSEHTNKYGEQHQSFEQHSVVLLGEIAEKIVSECEIDDLVFVKGPIRTRKRCAASGEIYRFHEIVAAEARLVSKWADERERKRHDSTQKALGF